jgi:hypothetical protein
MRANQREKQMRFDSLVAAVLAVLACQPHVDGRSTQSPLRTRPALRLNFIPAAESFAAAAREYEQLWAAEGDRIVRVMEKVSGLKFRDTAITVIVYEGVSFSGYRDRPMRMRASYPPDTKKATLIHELGHRLQSGLFKRDEEEHGPLFLWLYDVWAELYGREFADAQVEVEKRRRGPYPKAWDDALALSPAERASRWRAIVAERLPTRR